MPTEKEICQAYTNRTTVNELCKSLNISRTFLYNTIKKTNTSLHKPQPLTDDEIDYVIGLYNLGMTCKECAIRMGLGASTISKVLKNRGIVVSPQGQFNRKYTLNEHFFKNIDTSEKAQILGLIYADGTLSSNHKHIAIRLNEQDRSYLEKISSIIGSNKPLITIYPGKMISPINGREYLSKHNTLSLDITSKEIYNDCLSLGLCPRKTWKNLHIPKIDPTLYSSFVLGLFEGDGCLTWNINPKNDKIHSCSFSIAGDFNMLNDIADIINEQLGISCAVYDRKHIHILAVANRHSITRIYHWLYRDTSLYMERKKKKFETFFSLF